jgi:hypothetical protein
MAQLLPDRDELRTKFLQRESSAQAAQDLIDNFQMGGLRTIIRNLLKLPPDLRVQYGRSLSYMDLSRFANDLNANLENAQDPETRAMCLMMLATLGRSIAPAVFEKYIADESQPMMVRLAAMSGRCKIQNPAIFDRFYELADEAVVEPHNGRNDLAYADVSKDNLPFFLYTKAQVEKKEASHGLILSAISVAGKNSTDIYKSILDKKKKKYLPLLVDRAIQVGGVQLLESMAGHRTAKRYKAEISFAMSVAKAVAKYRDRFMDQVPQDKTPIGPVLPINGTGTGKEDYRAAYAVVQVTAEGDIKLLSHDKPYGGDDNLQTLLTGKTQPAYLDWKPVESYALVIAP